MPSVYCLGLRIPCWSRVVGRVVAGDAAANGSDGPGFAGADSPEGVGAEDRDGAENPGGTEDSSCALSEEDLLSAVVGAGYVGQPMEARDVAGAAVGKVGVAHETPDGVAADAGSEDATGGITWLAAPAIGSALSAPPNLAWKTQAAQGMLPSDDHLRAPRQKSCLPASNNACYVC